VAERLPVLGVGLHGLPYVIVYRVDEELDELTVVAIFHGAQDR
jgi:plasmid stabilization system protein ParE